MDSPPHAIARPAQPPRRKLGTSEATLIGLGSMIGAGVFVVFGLAARAAGGWLLIGLLLAAVVAVCNALSSAQLLPSIHRPGGHTCTVGIV